MMLSDHDNAFLWVKLLPSAYTAVTRLIHFTLGQLTLSKFKFDVERIKSDI